MEQHRLDAIRMLGPNGDVILDQMAKLTKQMMGDLFARMAEEHANSPLLAGVSGRDALLAFSRAIRTQLERDAQAEKKGVVPS